jgi:hypothetical protein
LSTSRIPFKGLLVLSFLCLASPILGQTNKAKNQKNLDVYAAPSEIQHIQGAWGLFFGQDKKTLIAMLEHRGAHWLEMEQCSKPGWPRTQVIFSDNPAEPKCSAQLLLQLAPVKRAELNIGTNQTLTGIRLILPHEDSASAWAAIDTWTKKLRLKYGKESCEVFGEGKNAPCLVKTWTGNDESYLQLSLTDDGVMFNYNSADRAANLEQRGLEKLQSQGGFSSAGGGDF